MKEESKNEVRVKMIELLICLFFCLIFIKNSLEAIKIGQFLYKIVFLANFLLFSFKI